MDIVHDQALVIAHGILHVDFDKSHRFHIYFPLSHCLIGGLVSFAEVDQTYLIVAEANCCSSLASHISYYSFAPLP